MRMPRTWPILLLALALIWMLVRPGGTRTASADTSYVVQPGDTLAAISRRFGPSIEELAAANNLINPNLIYVGQVLTIPDGSGETPPPPAPPPGPTTTYTVAPGDTLTRISLRFGVSTSALAAANGLSNPNFIYVGQVLTIPGAGTPPPAPTATPAPGPAPTAVPTPIPTAPPPPPPPTGANLLPNSSFEEGWYNHESIPELQVPNHWSLIWDEGDNPLDPDAWNDFVRPETRVLSEAFLPPAERGLFIYDGAHTFKAFKQWGAISFRLQTAVNLNPGTYVLTINVFPDLVTEYQGGTKVWAPDPLSGEVRLFAGNGDSGWIFPTFGQRNTFTYRFTVAQAGTVTVGAAVRGRWAIANNGWFMDAWTLQKQ